MLSSFPLPSSSFISKLLPRLLTDVILSIWHEIVSGQAEISQHAFIYPLRLSLLSTPSINLNEWFSELFGPTSCARQEPSIWTFFQFAHQRNAVFFRTKPTASVLEDSFHPDIQVVTIKSHDNYVFYEISVIAWLKGNTGFYVSTILVIAICFDLDGINSSENLKLYHPMHSFKGGEKIPRVPPKPRCTSSRFFTFEAVLAHAQTRETNMLNQNDLNFFGVG